MFVRVANDDAYEVILALKDASVIVRVKGQAVAAAANGTSSRSSVVAGMRLLAKAINVALVDAGIGAMAGET